MLYVQEIESLNNRLDLLKNMINELCEDVGKLRTRVNILEND
jgi:hypothetical protein